MMKYALLALLSTAPIAASAQPASTLFASGKLFGGPSQGIVVCYVTNLGSKPVSVNNLGVVDQYGNATYNGSINCEGGSMPPHSSCITTQVTSPNTSYDCSAMASSTATLRGSEEIRDSNAGSPAVLQYQPMR